MRHQETTSFLPATASPCWVMGDAQSCVTWERPPELWRARAEGWWAAGGLRAQLAQAWLGGGTGMRVSDEEDDELALLLGSSSDGDDEAMGEGDDAGDDSSEDGNASPRGTKGRDTCASPVPRQWHAARMSTRHATLTCGPGKACTLLGALPGTSSICPHVLMWKEVESAAPGNAGNVVLSCGWLAAGPHQYTPPVVMHLRCFATVFRHIASKVCGLESEGIQWLQQQNRLDTCKAIVGSCHHASGAPLGRSPASGAQAGGGPAGEVGGKPGAGEADWPGEPHAGVQRPPPGAQHRHQPRAVPGQRPLPTAGCRPGHELKLGWKRPGRRPTLVLL